MSADERYLMLQEFNQTMSGILAGSAYGFQLIWKLDVDFHSQQGWASQSTIFTVFAEDWRRGASLFVNMLLSLYFENFEGIMIQYPRTTDKMITISLMQYHEDKLDAQLSAIARKQDVIFDCSKSTLVSVDSAQDRPNKAYRFYKQKDD